MEKFLNIQFPTSDNENGEAFASDTNSRQIAKSNLLHLFLSTPGVRPMRPKWGCNLMSKLFELKEQSLNSEIIDEIRSCVTLNLIDVQIVNITINSTNLENNIIEVNVDYNFRDGSLILNDSITLQV